MFHIVFLIVVLCSATIQGNETNTNGTTDPLGNILNYASNYISVSAELLVNVNKIFKHFVDQVKTTQNSRGPISGSPLVVLVTSNQTQNCTALEGSNFITLCNNTIQSMGSCLTTVSSSGGSIIHGISYVLSNVTQLATTAISNVTHCIASSNNNILSLPLCIFQQVQYVNNDLGVIVNQTISVINTAADAVGSVGNIARSCIAGIITGFLSSIFTLITDFANCIGQYL